MIYKDGKKVIPYKDDYQPIKVYKDGKLISSAEKVSEEGTSLAIESEYKTPCVKKVNGYTEKVFDGNNYVYSLQGSSEVVKSKNIWNEKNIVELRHPSDNALNTARCYIQLDESYRGKTFTITNPSSFRIGVVSYTNGTSAIQDQGWKSGNFTFTFTRDINAMRFCFNLSKVDNSNITSQDLIELHSAKIMLNEGSTALAYEPYHTPFIRNAGLRNLLVLNDIQSTSINGITYSLLNGELLINGTYNSTTSSFAIQQRYYREENILIPGCIYNVFGFTEGSISISNKASIQFFKDNVAFANYSEGKFVCPDYDYFRYIFYISANSGTIFNNYRQKLNLIEGDVKPTQYIPADNRYHFVASDGTLISRDYPARLGDVIRTDGVDRITRGSYTITNVTTGYKTNTDVWVGYNYSISDIIKRPADNNTIVNVTISCDVEVSQVTANNQFGKGILGSLAISNAGMICIVTPTGATSVSAISEWLSQHPITIEYELATPQTILNHSQTLPDNLTFNVASTKEVVPMHHIESVEGIYFNGEKKTQLPSLNKVGTAKDYITWEKGKNLLKINEFSNTTVNGVTYSIKDGVITLNGTATGNINLWTALVNIIPRGNITYGIFIENNTVSLVFNIARTPYDWTNRNYFATTTGTFKNVVITDYDLGALCIQLTNGTTYNNVKLKPFIAKGSTPPSSFEPYYEKAMLHKEIGEVVLNGSENWTTRLSSAVNGYIHELSIPNIDNTGSATNIVLIINNDYQYNFNLSANKTYRTQNPVLALRNDSITNVNDFKNWLSANPLKIVYKLAIPTDTPLDLDSPLTAPNIETTLTADGGVVEAEWYEAK